MAILRSAGRPLTRNEILAQLPSGWTRSDRPGQILDARLAELCDNLAAPVERRRQGGATVFLYSIEKLDAIEAQLRPIPPLQVNPIYITVDQKTAVEGAADVENLAKALLSVSEAVRLYGSAMRGPGGKQGSDYSLQVVATLEPGSVRVPIRPKTQEAFIALLALVGALRSAYEWEAKFGKALQPLEKYGEQYVGKGRPVRSLTIEVPAFEQEARIDEEWLEAHKSAPPPPGGEWIDQVSGAIITVGTIEENDWANSTFRVGAGVPIEQLSFSYDRTVFRDVDRYRRKQVGILAGDGLRARALVLIPRFSAIPSGVDILSPMKRELFDRLSALKRSGMAENVERIVTVFAWVWLTNGRLLPTPTITPEADGGVGLWWQERHTKRELDLDFLDGQWVAVLTVDIDKVRSAETEEELDSLVTTRTIASDQDYVFLASWLLGRESVEELVLF